MRYAVFSGPQGAVTNFEGVFASSKEADIQVESGDDSNYYKIVDLELGTVYTSEGALPEAELTPDRDYVAQLDSGEALWIEVQNAQGKKALIHIVHQDAMNNVRVEAQDPNEQVEFDEPIEEFVVEFS